MCYSILPCHSLTHTSAYVLSVVDDDNSSCDEKKEVLRGLFDGLDVSTHSCTHQVPPPARTYAHSHVVVMIVSSGVVEHANWRMG